MSLFPFFLERGGLYTVLPAHPKCPKIRPRHRLDALGGAVSHELLEVSERSAPRNVELKTTKPTSRITNTVKFSKKNMTKITKTKLIIITSLKFLSKNKTVFASTKQTPFFHSKRFHRPIDLPPLPLPSLSPEGCEACHGRGFHFGLPGEL